MTRALTTLMLATGTALTLVPSVDAGMRRAVQWGSEGFANGQFGTGREAVGGDRQWNSPGGIVVSRGSVFVADTSNNRIQRFSLSGGFQRKWGSFQFDPGATRVGARRGYILPQGLAADAGGNIYIADNRNDRAVKTSRNGAFRRRIGRRGSIGSQMVSPWGIAVSASTVYVVDQGNSRIQKYSLNGAYRGSFGSFGTTRGALRAPYGIAANRAGNIYVSDTGPDQIYRFTSRGRLLGVFGERGSGPGQFNQPAGLALDTQGNLLVADCANQRVQRLTQAERFIEAFGRGSLRNPSFVAAAPNGSVFVSDYREVVRFDPFDGVTPSGSPPDGVARSACTSQAERAQ